MDQLLLTPTVYLLIAANAAASFIAFSNAAVLNRFLFHVGPILRGKEYDRVITSGFLHGGVLHLFVNMYVLWMFGRPIEAGLGPVSFALIYFAALTGGSLWSLMENRRKSDYRALGASGATSGIVMAFILFRPLEPLMIFPIPFFMPAVVIGIGFVVISAVLAQRENKVIGHEAHLGGALAGILATIAIEPAALSTFSSEIVKALGR
ncbi:MAG: rhomboid family intramembrane serine protease [Pseudomonadota bacterium]